MIIDFLKVIRYKNLFALSFLLIVLRFGFLKFQQVTLVLTTFDFSLLLLSIVLIAASGYIINDVFDQKADAINRPTKSFVGKSISIKVAYYFYSFLNTIAFMIGYYLSDLINKPSFVLLFIIIAILLYMYATILKKYPLVNNILAAFLISFTIIIIGLFDLYPNLNTNNQAVYFKCFGVLIEFAFFAFVVNLMREIVKDIQDINGDFVAGIKTLPILIGEKKSRIIVGLLAISLAILIVYYIYFYYFKNSFYIDVIYILVTVLLPLIYFALQILHSNSNKNYKFLARLLKIIIFFGILSTLVLSFNELLNSN